MPPLSLLQQRFVLQLQQSQPRWTLSTLQVEAELNGLDKEEAAEYLEALGVQEGGLKSLIRCEAVGHAICMCCCGQQQQRQWRWRRPLVQHTLPKQATRPPLLMLFMLPHSQPTCRLPDASYPTVMCFYAAPPACIGLLTRRGAFALLIPCCCYPAIAAAGPPTSSWAC